MKLPKKSEVDMPQFGVKVTMRFNGTGTFASLKDHTQVLRNITEIHYGYKSSLKRKGIAFESNIHETGCTYDIVDIEEFETESETEISPTGF